MDEIKVAILDTGIGYSKYIPQKCIENEYIVKNGEINIGRADDIDGHGTECAFEIYRQCPDVKFTIIKVMEKGIGIKENLRIALEYLCNLDVQIINMSLAYFSIKNKDDLYQKYIQIIEKDKVIIAALGNNKQRSYPAIYENIIGVKGVEFQNNEIWFSEENEIQCLCDNNTYICPGIYTEYELYPKSNSVATARVTGIIAQKYLETQKKINIDNTYNILKNIATKHWWNEKDIFENIRNPVWYREEKSDFWEIIKNIVKEYVKVDYKKWENQGYCILGEKAGITYRECVSIIINIRKKININIDYFKCSRKIFASLYSLDKFVEEVINNED